MPLAPQRNVIPSAARDLLLGLEAYVGAHVDKRYSVYILASRSRNLYTGMTNSMMRRLAEHRENACAGVHVGISNSSAGLHSKLTWMCASRFGGRRKSNRGGVKKRVALIEAENPTWRHLAEEWFAKYPAQKQIPPARKRPPG